MSIYSNSKIRENEILELEADFGMTCIEQFCSTLRQDARVLEVGSGPAVLLEKLKERFPKLELEGLEPDIDNYGAKKGNNCQNNILIHRLSYEQFIVDKKFDFIFSINVFEHLNDWKHFIDKTATWLQPGGVCVILCPNYGFPYESHYGLPIVFNKKTTFKIFKTSIQKFDEKNNTYGLWDTLNFVKKKDVLNFLGNHSSFKYHDMLGIVRVMLARAEGDKKFRSRHQRLAFLCGTIERLGLLYFLRYFKNYIPYMQIVLEKR